MTGGDSAIVAMQYSYLPSWMSYLVDQSKAREAGRALFDAVYERWSRASRRRPAPKLLVFGESLGSFGGETAFSGEPDLRNRTSGAVFAGPPNFNTLFPSSPSTGTPGSPESLPVYRGGRTVRFTNDADAEIPPSGRPWDGTRVLYLHAPVGPHRLVEPPPALQRTGLAGEPPGKDVLEGVVWLPLVTFWQVTADLTFAGGVPEGHGHAYKAEYVAAWNTVLRPADVTPDELAALQAKAAAIP